MNISRWIQIISIFLSIICFSFSLSAQTNKARSRGEISQLTQAISNEIFSPFCPGKTLDMCPSPNAAEVRRTIQSMASEGKNKEEIKDAVLLKYGDEFRVVEPPAQDNVSLFVVLLIGLGIAIFLVILLSRTKTQSSSAEHKSEAQEEENDDQEQSEDEADDYYLKNLRDEIDDDL